MPDQDTGTAVAFRLNGVDVEARKGELLIDAAERHGVYIPRFCYHPRMQPVGMCRMCIVEIDTGRGPALQPACMLPVAPDMSVDTESPATKKVQDGILEFLLINHPLDCPVCDKGGECPLQDHTMAFGPGESRFVEEKRHFEKPIAISETVYLDRERCILCDRCTRFAKDVAGDPFISFLDRSNETQVNTFPDEPFSSYFSGNTVQICPVGALTAKPYRFRARPWDLDVVESTCTSCAVGCRVLIDGSRDRVLRYNGVDIDPVNWGWLCDKGRFDFEAVDHPDRLGVPLVRGSAGGALAEARWNEALGAAAEAIKDGLDRSGPDGLAVLGGARLTNEDAYAWAKLAKGVLGTDNVDAQLADGLPAELVLGLPRATIDETFAAGGTVLLLAPDLKEELPVLFLRLRHAVVEDKVSVVELAQHDTGVSGLAKVSLRYRPGETAELIQAVLDGGPLPSEVDAAAAAAAGDLLRAGPVTVILGRSSLAESAQPTLTAAAYLVDALDGVRFLPALRRANVHGALDMGLAPGVLPGRTSLDEGRDWYRAAWPTVPDHRGLDATGMLQAAADGRIDTLVLLGADPVADFPDRDLAVRALAGARTVIATDLFLTASSAQADIVLPAAGYAECDGTTTNLEGRISTLGQKVTPPGTARTDWMIAAELAYRLGADLELESAAGIWAEIERLAPSHAGITLERLATVAGSDGIVAPMVHEPRPATEAPPADTAVPGGAPDRVVTDESGAAGEPTAPTGDATDDPEAHADAASAGVAAAAGGNADEVAAEHAEAAEASADAVSADGGDAPEAGDEAGEQDRAGGTGTAAHAQTSGRPRPLVFDAADVAPAAPPVDAYSLRLITYRKLYDQGTIIQHSPSSAGLAKPGDLLVSAFDLERLGLVGGGRVKVVSARSNFVVDAVPDTGLPRGTAALVWNQGEPCPADLIDVGAPVTEIRLETTP